MKHGELKKNLQQLNTAPAQNENYHSLSYRTASRRCFKVAFQDNLQQINVQEMKPWLEYSKFRAWC